MLIGMKRIFLQTGLLCALAFPAMASSGYETPEYSGPGARIEHGGFGNDPSPLGRPATGPSTSDNSFESHIENRSQRISKEMDRRRDEAQRIKEEHILKINE
jgi:hypothetical protein